MLGKALNTSPEFWLGLQADHDLSRELLDKDCLDKLEGIEALV
jgi:plasmid maintenance system antidote protein VapI